MTKQPRRSPLGATALVDEYFVENRNRLLEIAAFLDRIDRADPNVTATDFRMRAFTEGVATLSSRLSNRLHHIQMLLSDPNVEPRDALDRKSARGAYDPSQEEAGS